MNECLPAPGRDLLVKVRGAFTFHHSSLSAWCKSQGIELSVARATLMGGWDGPKARELRKRIVSDSGLVALIDNVESRRAG